ncbi:MAG: Asp23/Gls24 family envelope stress response protein [Bacillota bacterium]
MTIKVSNDMGEVLINENVVAKLAGVSAMECYGLVGMVSKNTTTGLIKLLKNEHLNKGVEVETFDDGIVIDLFVIIQFGTKISVVAENIINQVKFNIEKQTGLEVKKVNLNIEGVKTK